MSSNAPHIGSSTSDLTHFPQNTSAVHSNGTTPKNQPVSQVHNNNNHTPLHRRTAHSRPPSTLSKTFRLNTKTPPPTRPRPATPTAPGPKRTLALRHPHHHTPPATPTRGDGNHNINSRACLEWTDGETLASLERARRNLETTLDALLSRVPLDEAKCATVRQLLLKSEALAAQVKARIAAEEAGEEELVPQESYRSGRGAGASGSEASSPSPFSAQWVPSRTFLETVGGDLGEPIRGGRGHHQQDRDEQPGIFSLLQQRDNLPSEPAHTLGEAFLAARAASTTEDLDPDSDSETDEDEEDTEEEASSSSCSNATYTLQPHEQASNNARVLNWLARVPRWTATELLCLSDSASRELRTIHPELLGVSFLGRDDVIAVAGDCYYLTGVEDLI